MYQYDRGLKDTDDEGIWSIYGIKDFGLSGECKLQKVQIRRFYLKICQDLYTGSMLQRFGAGSSAACYPNALSGSSSRLECLDLQGIDLPRH